MACFLTSYFEDIISETDIWNTFIKTHQKLYKKSLPFYILEEYNEGEINLQDISFLIWYFVNCLQEEKFVAPFNDFIIETARKVMDVFDEAWEYAPENEHLNSFYQLDENEADFYVTRNLIDTILFKTYLFYPDTLLKLRIKEVEIMEDDIDRNYIVSFLNENRDNTLHTSYTRLLSLKGKEWVANLLGDKHPLSSDLLNISERISGFFLYKGQDEQDVFIEHIASGKKFNMTKKSFDNSGSLKEIDDILFIGIARWKDEWWFSGVFIQQEFNPDLILDEKNSLSSRMAVSFLDHQRKEAKETFDMQFTAFKNFNTGSPIKFLPSDKIESFYKGYIDFYNDSLHLSEEEINEAKRRTKKDGFFGVNDESNDFSELSDTGLVFFNPKGGCEIALAVNSAFPLPDNPYFDAEHSEEHIIRLLMDESISAELVMYCIEHCKKKLPFFNDGLGKMYLDDIDFLLRFWKKSNYHTNLSVTFTGQNN